MHGDLHIAAPVLRRNYAHTLLALVYLCRHEFEKYMNVPEKFEAPDKQEYETKVHLSSWLLDDKLRDQFVLRSGRETQVFWNDPHRKMNSTGRELKYGGEREKSRGKTWTESYVGWSNHGLYLATFHTPGKFFGV